LFNAIYFNIWNSERNNYKSDIDGFKSELGDGISDPDLKNELGDGILI
jgi:hypothetical protein